MMDNNVSDLYTNQCNMEAKNKDNCKMLILYLIVKIQSICHKIYNYKIMKERVLQNNAYNTR